MKHHSQEQVQITVVVVIHKISGTRFAFARQAGLGGGVFEALAFHIAPQLAAGAAGKIQIHKTVAVKIAGAHTAAGDSGGHVQFRSARLQSLVRRVHKFQAEPLGGIGKHRLRYTIEHLFACEHGKMPAAMAGGALTVLRQFLHERQRVAHELPADGCIGQRGLVQLIGPFQNRHREHTHEFAQFLGRINIQLAHLAQVAEGAVVDALSDPAPVPAGVAKIILPRLGGHQSQARVVGEHHHMAVGQQPLRPCVMQHIGDMATRDHLAFAGFLLRCQPKVRDHAVHHQLRHRRERLGLHFAVAGPVPKFRELIGLGNLLIIRLQ